jgi:hypothetical protein
MAPRVKFIEQDYVTLKVAPLNGGLELRLVAPAGPEHRLRLSVGQARELLRMLTIC